MNVPYRSFAELVLCSEQGRDFAFRLREPGGAAVVKAIHGGAIEPLTGELAEAVAGSEYNLYVFQGLRVGECARMRIPPLGYDELRLRALLERAQIAVALDGVAGPEQAIYVSGGNARLAQALAAQLEAAGLPVAAVDEAFSATGFYFNAPSGGGAQIELSWGLRAALIDVPLEAQSWVELEQRNSRFSVLARAIRAGIARHLAEAASDLGATLARFEEATRRFPPSLRQTGSDAHYTH